MKYWLCGEWRDAPGGLQEVLDALYPYDPEVEVSNLRRGLRSDRRGLQRGFLPAYQLRQDANVFCRVEGSDVVGAQVAPHGGLWAGTLGGRELVIDVGVLARRRLGMRPYHAESRVNPGGFSLLRSDHPVYTSGGFTPFEGRVRVRLEDDFASVSVTPEAAWTFSWSTTYRPT